MASQQQPINLHASLGIAGRAATPGGNKELADILSELPVSSRASQDEHPTTHVDVDTVISRELDLDRLGPLQSRLWFAGQPGTASPLHKQLSIHKNIVITEQLDLHLVYGDGQMLIKPLPGYLLQREFWQTYLTCDEPCRSCGRGHEEQTFEATPTPSRQQGECVRAKNRQTALGFLFTYACLITYESDYHIAKQLHLLPELKAGSGASWKDWRGIMEGILDSHDMTKVNARFLYGELNLSRLDLLYFYHHMEPYVFRYYPNSLFISEHIAVIAAVLVYVAIVLSAMQVGLTTNVLRDDDRFHQASYGFSILAIFGPLGAIFVLGIGLLMDHVITSLSRKAKLAAARQALQGQGH